MATSRGKVSPLPIALLGIPITNQPLSETISLCLQHMQENRREGKVSYYTMIDPLTIDISYGWQPTSVNHPELLSILRNAAVSSISGKFLTSLGRLLGSPMAPTYTIPELTNALCEALGERKMGIFLIGDHEKITKAVAIRLHDKYTQLRLVGIAAPPIFVGGRDLATAPERDALLIEQINASHADILIVNLDNIVQELWLERIRRGLSVPFILAVGKALTNLSSTPSPLNPMQQVATVKEASFIPARPSNPLSRKLKLFWIACPLVIYHHLNRFIYETLSPKQALTIVHQKSKLFLSAHHSVATISLPRLIDHSNVAILRQLFEESASHDAVLFDFREVRHIQPEGFHFLIKAWLRRNKENKAVYGFQPTWNIRNLMKVHHTWDLFKYTLCDSPEALLSRLKAYEKISFYDAFAQTENLVTISLLGALDQHIDYTDYINKLTPIIGNKNCLIDFSYCTLIDNTGFAFLLNLRKRLQSQHRTLTLSCLSPALKAQFQAASV